MKILDAMYGKELDVQQAVILSLDGNDQDRGSVESAAATANNVAEAFGTLIEILHAKGALNDADVKKFLGWRCNAQDDA